MQEVHVFTSSALNYIPKVRALLESVRNFHPEWRFHLALSENLGNEAEINSFGFDSIVPIDRLNIPDWKKWAFCHNIVELSTAIKPFMFIHLFRHEQAAKVIYFDPDTVLFSRLDDIVSFLDSSSILLTPHQTDPELTLGGVRDNEISSLKHGVFNLGFLGLARGAESYRFSKWWADRLYHFCVDNIPQGLFTDQRWMDLVPCLFDEVGVVRSTRHNVATWNLTTRELSKQGDQVIVDNEPLGFYHFTGFDSGAHHLMKAKVGRNNTRQVDELLEWYADYQARCAEDPLLKKNWGLRNFYNGVPITKEQRLVFRLREDLWQAFDDPFDPNGYLNWWTHQGRSEFPGLFDAANFENEYKRLKGLLPAGFRGKSGVDFGALASMVASSLSSPASMKAVSGRAMTVFKQEGLRGIFRRIR